MTTHIKDDFGNDWYFEDAQHHVADETGVTTGDPCRDALQAIITWADFALKNKDEFDSHGVSILTGPTFDAARSVLSETETAAPTSQTSVKVPEGWVIVPLEPTTEMECAPDHEDCVTPDAAKAVYRAMLAAAPPSPLDIVTVEVIQPDLQPNADPDLLEVLKRIASHTDPDDPESYRSDDREGCLDTVQAIAVAAIAKAEGSAE